MREITVWVARGRFESPFTLHLPTTMENITDVLERVDQDPEHTTLYSCSFGNDQQFLADHLRADVNIFELNHLAQLLSEMELPQHYACRGGIKIFEQKQDLTVADMINLAMNAKEDKVMTAYPAENDYELGEFFMENKLVPELKDFTIEQLEWVMEHADYERIGTEIYQQHGGVFNGNAYVTVSGELEQLYDGKIEMPQSLGGIFKLKLIKLEENEDSTASQTKELILPLPHIEPQDFEDITGYTLDEFHSAIPQLNDVLHDLYDTQELNELAHRVAQIAYNGELVKYKAMLETLPEVSLETAITASSYTDEYELSSHITFDYATEKMTPIPADMAEYFDLKSYGREMMEKDGAKNTVYGAVIPNDGMTLQEKMEQADLAEQEMESAYQNDMEMGCMSL